MIAGKPAVGVVAKKVQWLWKPYIPYGRVTLVQGDTGIGKTSLMMKIVAEATRGLKPPTQFQGRLYEQEETEPLTVFYVTTENGIDDTLIPMFDLYGGKRENLYYQDEDEGHFVLNADEIRAVIEQFGAKLIVIDPWQGFLDDITSSNNDRLRDMILDIQRVAKEKDAAVVLCGNFSKARGGSDLDKGLGGSAIFHTLRSVLTVCEDPFGSSSIRILKASKMSFVGKERSPLGLKQENDYTVSYIQWLDYAAEQEKKRRANVSGAGAEEAPARESGETDSAIVKAADFLKEALRDDPLDSATLYALARESGVSRTTLNRAKHLAGAHSKKQGDGTSLRNPGPGGDCAKSHGILGFWDLACFRRLYH